jgi:nucleoside-diphosphate-sugar epimerase
LTAAPGHALVLGATGHIGNAIARDLLDHGYRVTAATRQQRPEALADLAVEIVRGDADRPGQIAAWVRGHDLVIDAAAPYPLNVFVAAAPPERAPLEYARRRMGTLLDAVSRHDAALGYVSAFTTLPRPDSEGILAAIEARARRLVHPYFIVKATMEEMVLEAARSGVRAAIFNPTACIGPWDRRPRELCVVPLLMTGQVPAIVARVVNVIDVRDVAAAVRAALERHRFGAPIPLAGHNSRTDALATRVCNLAGVPAPRLHVSARLAAGAALWGEAAWAFVGRPSPLPTIVLLLILDGYPMRPSAEQRALGAMPRPLDETLRDSIAWYRHLGHC